MTSNGVDSAPAKTRPPRRTRRGFWTFRRFLGLVAVLLIALTAAAAVIPCTRWLEGSGHVITDSEVKLQASVEGPVERWLARNGDTVEKGQLLIQLNDSVQRAALDQALSQLQAKRAKLDHLKIKYDLEDSQRRKQIDRLQRRLEAARDQLKKLQAAAASGGAATGELEKAKLELDLTTSQLAELKLSREGVRAKEMQVLTDEIDAAAKLGAQHRVQIELRKVVSPMSGVVYFNRYEPGEVIKPEDVLGQVFDRSAWVIKLQLPERCITYVKTGQSVEVSLGAYPPLRYGYLEGEVSRIWRVVTPQSTGDGTFTLEARLRLRAEMPLEPGLSARGRVNAGRTTLLFRLLGW